MSLINGYNPTVGSAPMGREISGEPAAYLTEATIGLTQDICNVLEASHIADIAGEYAVIEGAASAEVVVEAIVSNTIENIKKAFRKFWQKIKDFYASVVKQIKLLFMTGEKFIAEFKSELDKKKEKGYKFQGYKYTPSEGGTAVSNVIATMEEHVATNIMRTNLKDYDAKGDDGLKGRLAAGSMTDDESYEETILKELAGKPETIGELKLELKKAFRSGEDTTEEIKDFEKFSKTQMMDYIKGKDKALSNITKEEKRFDGVLSKIIKALDAIKVDGEEDKDMGYKQAQIISKNCSTLLSIGKAATEVHTEMVKEIASASESALKGYLRFKPKNSTTKASFESTGVGVVDAIFESMNI